MERKIDQSFIFEQVYVSDEGESLAQEISEFLAQKPETLMRRVGKFALFCLKAAGEHYTGGQIFENRARNSDPED